MKYQPVWTLHLFVCTLFNFKVGRVVSMVANDFHHLQEAEAYASPADFPVGESIMRDKDYHAAQLKAEQEVGCMWSHYQKSKMAKDVKAVEDIFAQAQIELKPLGLAELPRVMALVKKQMLRLRCLLLEKAFQVEEKHIPQAVFSLTFDPKSSHEQDISENDLRNGQILSDLSNMFMTALRWQSFIPPRKLNYLARPLFLIVYLLIDYDLVTYDELQKRFKGKFLPRLAWRWYSFELNPSGPKNDFPIFSAAHARVKGVFEPEEYKAAANTRWVGALRLPTKTAPTKKQDKPVGFARIKSFFKKFWLKVTRAGAKPVRNLGVETFKNYS